MIIPGFKGGVADSLFDPLEKQTFQTARNLDVIGEQNILTPLSLFTDINTPADGSDNFTPLNVTKGSNGRYYVIGKITITDSNVALYSTAALAALPTWNVDFRINTGNTMSSAIEEFKDRIFFAYSTILKAWGLLTGTKPTFTVTIASPGIFTSTGHGLADGDSVIFTTTGALPTGLTAGTAYFVITAGLTADAFEVSATPGGSAVNTSGGQSGTHSLQQTKTISSSLTTGLDFLREHKGLGKLFFIHNSGKTIGHYDNTTVTLAALTLEKDDTAVGAEPYGRFMIIGIRSSAKKDRFLVWDGSATTFEQLIPTGDIGLQTFRVIGSTIHYLVANSTTGGQFFRYYKLTMGGEPQLIKEFKPGTTTGATTVSPNGVDFVGDTFQFAFTGDTYSLLDQVIWAYGSGGKNLPNLLTPLRTVLDGATTNKVFLAIKNLQDGLIVIWRNNALDTPYHIEATGISGNISDDGVYESNAFLLSGGLPAKIKRITINHKPLPASCGFTVKVKHFGHYPRGTSIPAEDSYAILYTPEGNSATSGMSQSTTNTTYTILEDPNVFKSARFAQIQILFDEVSTTNAASIIFPIIIETE